MRPIRGLLQKWNINNFESYKYKLTTNFVAGREENGKFLFKSCFFVLLMKL